MLALQKAKIYRQAKLNQLHMLRHSVMYFRGPLHTLIGDLQALIFTTLRNCFLGTVRQPAPLKRLTRS